ncbi:Potassium transporter [Burkholderiales bacterium]|nr:Potassium transporter [Burkholderiales bacterium]
MPTALELTLILLAASVIAVAMVRLFHQPPVLGYLVVGIAIGPHALAWVPDTAETRHLAELGIVFLMFSIGLEFSLPRLRSMRSIVLGLGMTQVILTLGATLVAGFVVGSNFGIGMPGAFALGAALAMSSTAILMKLLVERLELETEHGRRIVGVLLLQDLAVVPLLVIVPSLTAPPAQLGMAILIASAKAALLLLVLLLGGRSLLRAWFHLVARRRSQELFMLNLLLLTLGLAWLADRVGLSPALGAFVAGILLSETEYRHHVEEDVKPFRDVLLGLFFVTIGMALDLRVVLTQLPWVIAALVVPMGFKFALTLGLARVFGAHPGTAIKTALPLAAAGEFGFVLINLASDHQLLPVPLQQVVLAAMLLSMLTTPFLLASGARLALRFGGSEWMLRALELHRIAARSMSTERHVVICGYGRSGQHLAKMLEQENIGYVALDLDPDRVREAAAAGHTVVYGDAARRETLMVAGITRAAALVVSFSDVRAALRVIAFAHELNPRVPVIVRTQDDADLDRLLAAGATEVVPEVFEGSLMLGSHALVLLGIPLARVIRRVRDARDSRYRLLRGYFHGADDTEDGLEEPLQVRLHTIVLEADAPAVGRSLQDLDLATTGVEVTAVRRRGILGDNPSGDLVLQAGDIVVLRGTVAALEAGEQRLLLAR